MFRRFLIVTLTVVTILTAGWLALRRPDIPYEMLELKYAFADSNYLALPDGSRIHYRDVGPRRGDTVVLVHGFSASTHTWNDWVKDLRKTYRVIALDLPGHGLTSTPIETGGLPTTADFTSIITAVADEAGIEKFVLVGSSMGGGVSWNYALEQPERLNGLVLVDAAGWPSGPDEETQLIFQLLQAKFVHGIIKDLDMTGLVADGLRDSFADPSLVDDEMVERYVELSRAPGHRDILLALSTDRSERKVASSELLSAITVPTLVMHGEVDNLIPVEHGRKFHEAIKGSQLVVYPEVGHIPQEEIPDQSVGDLISFLKTIYEPEAESEIAMTDDADEETSLPN